MSMWADASGDYGMTSMEADPDIERWTDQERDLQEEAYNRELLRDEEEPDIEAGQ